MYQAALGVVGFAPYVVSFKYYFQEFKPTLITALILSLAYITIFGDFMGRHVMKLPQPITAFGKLLTSIIIAIMSGYYISKKTLKTDENTKHKVTKTWYVHSLVFGNITATFFGPFFFNIFLQKVYNDPGTGEGMRIVLATFGIPILFWILSTVGRFSCYSIAKYGEEGHSVWKPHFAHKALFVLQFVYSAYGRSMVIGMAGPTDLVGHSISKRWPLIVSAILTSIVAVLSRVTTKARDRFMCVFIFFLFISPSSFRPSFTHTHHEKYKCFALTGTKPGIWVKNHFLMISSSTRE